MDDGLYKEEPFKQEILQIFQTLLVKGFRQAAVGMWFDLFDIALLSTVWQEKATTPLWMIAKDEQGRAEINETLRAIAAFTKDLAENEPATQDADASMDHDSAGDILIEICERAAEQFILNQEDVAIRRHVVETLQDALGDHENRWLGACLEISDDEDESGRR